MWNIIGIGLCVFLGLVFLVGSLDDLFIDFCHMLGGLAPKFISKEVWKEWRAIPEGPIAVMVPAWQEASVLESMVRTNLSRIKYQNYRWFIGVYPNDLETLEIAKRVERDYPEKVTVVVTDRPGPTSKAHCLNCIVRVLAELSMIAKKEGRGWVPYYVAIHDAEDIIHPYSFTAINAQSRSLDFIQLPIFSLPVPAKSWVAGTYLDEFSEIHLKEIPVREKLTMPIPSAGVGTFFSWKILSQLLYRFGYCFNENNLTEDYEISQRIARLDGAQTFLLVRDESGQIVATREYFPDSFGRSVRQKTRWTTGIALQTLNEWGRFGRRLGRAQWLRNLAASYGLYRDRKSLWANPIAFLGWIFLVCSMIFRMELPKSHWIISLFMINLALFVIRLIQRARFTAQVYGAVHGVLSMPRVVYSNLINGLASLQAIKNYSSARRGGNQGKMAWTKTDHKFPDMKELNRLEGTYENQN